MVDPGQARREELRELVAEVLELEPYEIEEHADFRRVYDVDSLRAIEVLAQIEKRYGLDIPQPELAEMTNLSAIYDVVSRYAGWPVART
jgi:acyl carrier protein